jgi:hypothetical protein
MLDIAKIKAHSARIKAIISGKPYVAPVEPIIVPETITIPEVIEEVHVEHTEEYPLNQD